MTLLQETIEVMTKYGKLTIPVKDSGMKVPVSVTASNRTELIKEKDVRGSIGLTVDLDVFMSALAGSFP